MRAPALLVLLLAARARPYLVANHPCCKEPGENLTLAMVIDAYEIYGHDPTDKLDHLAHYQVEMMKIKRAPDQYTINEHAHVATEHLARFVHLHVKELKVLLIALDDAVDNMLTMYDNHDAIKTERVAAYGAAAGGAVPAEFYLSQEFYCGKNVYIFLSELYSDIYHMGRGPAPYCEGRAFHFFGFVHFLEDTKYFLEEDPSISFSMDNYMHGLECHLGICIFRFPFKKGVQHARDVPALPKAVVKCGAEVYKLPPLTAASCVIASGSFILDFNVQGVRLRHHDHLLVLPNGQAYYTREAGAPLACHHHVCEWNYTNFYGGPFLIAGDPGTGLSPVPPFIEQTTEPFSASTERADDEANITYTLDGCWYLLPPNYGSIAGVSYLDPLTVNEHRFTCQGPGGKVWCEWAPVGVSPTGGYSAEGARCAVYRQYSKSVTLSVPVGAVRTAAGCTEGLYWYPQWMGAPPHQPYPRAEDAPSELTRGADGVFYPLQQAPAPPTVQLPEMA